MLIEQVRKTINEHDLIQRKQHIVLGLSGGPDSVCLFHVLMTLSGQLGITVHPVHINHKLRPGAAERDQKYAEQLCEKMGVKCSVFTVDCSEMARELSMTSEEAGRVARYDAFHETAEKIAAELQAEGLDEETARSSVRIAVAHNAGDQAETILFRLLRGTGTDGLAGIAYERKERGFSVIRPILDVDRAAIEEYCERNGLDPVIDHTNSEAIYARNKIRLELIPLLESEYNENIKASLVRLGRIASEDKDYLWQQTELAYREFAESVPAGDVQGFMERLQSGVCEGSVKNRQSGACDPHMESVQPGICNSSMENPPVSAGMIVMDREKLAAAHPAVRHRLIMKAFAQIGLEKDISEERIKSADAIISKKQGAKTVEFPHCYRLKVAKGKVMFFRD